MIDLMKRNYASKNRRSGLTLLEVLISMFIFAGALIVITRFTLDLTGYGLFFGEVLEIQEELSKTFKVMSAELRSMGPADTGAYPIALATGSTLTFFSDYNGDQRFEQIRYYFNGTTLMRGITHSTGNPPQYLPANEQTSEAVHNVSSNPATTFSYFAAKYTGVEAPLSAPINIPLIRLITATVTANKNISGGSAPASQTIKATIRNFRTQQ